MRSAVDLLQAGRSLPVLADWSPASFIDPLAERGVPIFAVATFDTDYVLVKEEFAATALETLQTAGHELIT